MHSPPHPGESLKLLYLEPLSLNIKDTAKKLNITRTALSEIVHGKRGVSPKVAIKLAKAFGGSPESWLRQQMQFDLWQVQQSYDAEDVEVIYTPAALEDPTSPTLC